MSAARERSPVGSELARRRRQRGWSQLRLATTAATSPRYVSFVETGRSRPSRAVLLRLAEALDLPLRERNRLLSLAGFAPAFPERPLDGADLAAFRHVVDTLLARHEPYPALAFDRGYRLVDANRAARRLLGDGDDWIDALFAPASPLRAAMENFAEVAHATLAMLHAEGDGAPPRSDTLARLARHLAAVPPPATPAPDAALGTLTPRFRFGDQVVRTVSTVVRFGVARDLTLDELRVELVFPLDAASARFFEAMAASDPGLSA